jgi:hypothetical protein
VNANSENTQSNEWNPASRPFTGETPVVSGGRSHSGGAKASPDLDEAERSQLFLLQMENASLRRMLVELIEKNQHLREKVNALSPS